MTDLKHRLAGGILAGGASRRFGRDKAEALLDGKSLRDHVSANLHQAGCAPILESNNTANHQLAIADCRDDAGPLAGIEALLTRLQDEDLDWLLSCPVDIPVLPDDFGPVMLAAAQKHPDKICLAQPDNQDAWLCAIWPLSALSKISAWLDSGNRRVMPFLKAEQAISVPFSAAPERPAAFCNINQQNDLETVAKLMDDVSVAP